MGAAWRRTLVDGWQRRGLVALALWPLSLLYRLLAGAHRLSYRTGLRAVQRAGVPVVVVGNVVAGGAGKTPVVVALVRHLRSRGARVGVVSRGYGRQVRDCREVLPDDNPEHSGDEPLLIRRLTDVPVFVAPERAAAAQALRAAYPDTAIIVSDDGMQHWGLHRDIEVCVFDDRGIGNGWHLPAGPLRESWPRSTDLVLAPGAARIAGAYGLDRTLAERAQRADGSTVALSELGSRGHEPSAQLWAAAGIARPEVFFTMLRARGLRLDRTFALPDHADFQEPLWTESRQHVLLCTEKDAVKLWHRRPDALAVPLELHIDEAFWAAFDRLLEQRSGARLSSAHGYKAS